MDNIIFNTNWDDYQSQLNEIFFSSSDKNAIQQNTPAYNDFWKFLTNYIAFQKQKNLNSLSKAYNPLLRINFDLPTKRIDKYIEREELQLRFDEGFKRRKCLSYNQLYIFKDIIRHYLAFLQKQNFSKVLKIKRDQQDLPIYRFKMSIVEAVHNHQVVIVAGDTGCGKSTQVPQYLMEAGFNKIACTQPRRIACMSLAKRVSYETLNEYGNHVAYQVRFERTRTQASKIIFLTEGLLLRQIEVDATLSQYDVIIMDEVHERHATTDFLLGVIKCILLQRKDLKLVLMSATINVEAFSSYFDGAPVCKVPGRMFPVEMQYMPQTSVENIKKDNGLDVGSYLRILQFIDKKYSQEERGDVLIFLPGLSDIISLHDAIKEYADKTNGWIPLPLHSSLSIDEQDKVFDMPPQGARKCIISTNIAETSVTIDGIRFVIDSGKMKEMEHDMTRQMGRLKEQAISKASAEQRKGRAGRTGPGLCFRMYSEVDFDSMDDYPTPEVQRIPLESLVLQMLSLGIPHPQNFPFIEAPPEGVIDSAVALLTDLGAIHRTSYKTSTSIDKSTCYISEPCNVDDISHDVPSKYSMQLTKLGSTLAHLPVDVVIGKMLVMGSIFKLIKPIITVAAGFCVQTIVTVRGSKDFECTKLRNLNESNEGDPISILNLFDAWLAAKANNEDTKRWCRKRGIEEQRLYEMSKLRRQFEDILLNQQLLFKQEDKLRSDDDAFTRKRKHADLRMLAELCNKRKEETRKKKILKLATNDFEIDSDNDNNGSKIESDIRDLEFRLTNNMGDVLTEVKDSQNYALHHINNLKIVIANGLYPNVAVPDDHNSYKRDSDQIFHTCHKSFVILHPTSVLYNEPESLQIKANQIKESSGFMADKHKGDLSADHQMLMYVSLLETNKPYLINCLRVPLLQTLLLCATKVRTDKTATRILVDDWLEINIDCEIASAIFFQSVIMLRRRWSQLVSDSLNLDEDKLSKNNEKNGIKKLKSSNELLKNLSNFLSTKVYYYVRRVHPTELSKIYAITDASSYSSGMDITEYLTMDCLVANDNATLSTKDRCQRHCSQCGFEAFYTLAELLQHLATCGSDDVIDDDVKIENNFICEDCGHGFKFTTVEMIKHRRTCMHKK